MCLFILATCDVILSAVITTLCIDYPDRSSACIERLVIITRTPLTRQTPHAPVSMHGADVDSVQDDWYPRVHRNNRKPCRLKNTEAVLQEGAEHTLLSLLSAAAAVIQRLQCHAEDVLPVCGSRCNFLCRGVLGQQGERVNRCQRNQSAHQEGWLCPGRGASFTTNLPLRHSVLRRC